MPVPPEFDFFTPSEALWTYDKVRGYQPVIAYWAEQGVIVADQFREGNVPAGMGNVGFVETALGALPEDVKARRVGADSALYEQELLRGLDRKGVEFAISADMTEELRKAVKAVAPPAWNPYTKPTPQGRWCDPKKGWAEVEFVPEEKGAKKGEGPFRYVGIRLEKNQPGLFDGRYEHFAVVTNRWTMEGNALLNWQRQRCGTVEWAHDLLKNDLGARTFPCGKFGANAAWYRFNVLAFNLKVALTKIGLPMCEGVRPHTLRMRLLHSAARVVSHSRSLSMIFPALNASRRQEVAGCRRRLRLSPA